MIHGDEDVTGHDSEGKSVDRAPLHAMGGRRHGRQKLQSLFPAFMVGLLLVSAGAFSRSPLTAGGNDRSFGMSGVGSGTDAPIRDLRLSEAPLFRVGDGARSGDPDLHGVTGAAVLADGSIMLSQGAFSSNVHLLHLSQEGDVLRTVGRTGDGPGEFAAISGLAALPDGRGVVSYDSGLRRVTRFSGDGQVTWTRRVLPIPGTTRGRGAFGLLGVMDAERVVLRQDVLQDGAAGGERHLLFLGSDEAADSTVSGVAIGPRYRVRFASSRLNEFGHPITIQLGDYSGPCFPERQHLATFGTVYEVDPQQGAVIALRDHGREVVYSDTLHYRVTESIQRRMRERLSGAPSDTVAVTLERIGAVGDRLPRWATGFADPDGRLWLQRATCYVPEAREWDVVDVDRGRLLGTIVIDPDRGRVLAARGDRVVLEVLGEFDEQIIEVYRLEDGD